MSKHHTDILDTMDRLLGSNLRRVEKAKEFRDIERRAKSLAKCVEDADEREFQKQPV